MTRTVTLNKPLSRYPTGWVIAFVIAAALAAIAFSLPSKAPSSSTPTQYETLDENFAP
ncbi:MAG: hypothetical protein ACE5HL_12860 [Terriglobia bacterium]